MPKVIITPNSIFNPLGVRILLGEVGVLGPMLQDETTITCMMTEDQISRFRNGRGAAHKVEIVPDVPVIIEDNTFVESDHFNVAAIAAAGADKVADVKGPKKAS